MNRWEARTKNMCLTHRRRRSRALSTPNWLPGPKPGSCHCHGLRSCPGHMCAGLWHLAAALAGRGLIGPMEEPVHCCPQAPVVLHGKEGLPGGTLRPAAQHTWSLQNASPAPAAVCPQGGTTQQVHPWIPGPSRGLVHHRCSRNLNRHQSPTWLCSVRSRDLGSV